MGDLCPARGSTPSDVSGCGAAKPNDSLYVVILNSGVRLVSQSKANQNLEEPEVKRPCPTSRWANLDEAVLLDQPYLLGAGALLHSLAKKGKAKDPLFTQIARPWNKLCVSGPGRLCFHRCPHQVSKLGRYPEKRTVAQPKERHQVFQWRPNQPGLRQLGQTPTKMAALSAEQYFKDFRSWRSVQDSRDRPVALEIFSGSRLMARALRRQCRNVTVFQLDISHGLQFDLAKKSIQQELIDFLASFHVVFVWLGTPSSSWPRARKNDGRGPGPLRDDDEFMYGFCDLSPKDCEKVKVGNV